MAVGTLIGNRDVVFIKAGFHHILNMYFIDQLLTPDAIDH
jgi:hypothetical protein